MKKRVGIGIMIAGMILTAAAIAYKVKKHTSAVSISIIGGADGPTSIFLAGKIGSDFSLAVVVIGIVLLLAGLGIYFKNKRS